jgi:hypothetical protein
VDDRQLLRDLQAAVERSRARGRAEEAAAIEAVLAQHGATLADVQRLLRAARTRRDTELSRLQGGLSDLIAEREAESETADAVDRFLRGRGATG